LLEGWLGRQFKAGEFRLFELQSLFDTPCMVSVVHETSEKTGKTYAAVKGISPLPKRMTPPAPESERIYVWLDEAEFDAQQFAKLPPWLQEKVAESPQYRRLISSSGTSSLTPPIKPDTPPPAAPAVTTPRYSEDLSDTIPY
jgi:hypothetical protein